MLSFTARLGDARHKLTAAWLLVLLLMELLLLLLVLSVLLSELIGLWLLLWLILLQEDWGTCLVAMWHNMG